MTGSQNSFGTTSRFNQLSYPRRVGVAVMVLLLGFAIADPSFLSGQAFVGAYQLDENDDVNSLLAKMGKSESTDMQPKDQKARPIGNYDATVDQLTIPSFEPSGQSTQSAIVQHVSYPGSSDTDSLPPISQQESPLSLPITNVTSDEFSQPGQHGGNSRGAAVGSIRFMGTIYPVN